MTAFDPDVAWSRVKMTNEVTWGAIRKARFVSVPVIDENLGRSDSGGVHRPGFEQF